MVLIPIYNTSQFSCANICTQIEKIIADYNANVETIIPYEYALRIEIFHRPTPTPTPSSSTGVVVTSTPTGSTPTPGL